MAYILPDEGLLTKSASHQLTYPELSALKQRAMSGDASAAIALAQLPQGDQRLAEMLVENFTGKSAKPKKAKKPKAVYPLPAGHSPDDGCVQKNATKAQQYAYFRRLSNSDDPSEREAARQALNGR